MYYSQAGEDKFLYENIFSKSDLFPKTYIEMGAIDGIRFSNSKYFDDHQNWTGILIEPNPAMFKKLKLNRPGNFLSDNVISNSRDPVEFSYFENENLSAVSGVTSTLTPHNRNNFYENKDPWYKDMRKSHLKTIVKTPVSLDHIIEQSQIEEFGFCSLDVEGHEVHVIRSYSFKREIHFFLIENNPNDREIGDILNRNAYSLICQVSHNKLYASKTAIEKLPSILDLKSL